MSSTLEEMLLSPKSDDALQNDLFELLGFDKFEFIQTLLQNRKEIVSSAQKVKKKKKVITNGMDKVHLLQRQQMQLKLQHQQVIQSNNMMLQQQSFQPHQPHQNGGESFGRSE